MEKQKHRLRSFKTFSTEKEQGPNTIRITENPFRATKYYSARKWCNDGLFFSPLVIKNYKTELLYEEVTRCDFPVSWLEKVKQMTFFRKKTAHLLWTERYLAYVNTCIHTTVYIWIHMVRVQTFGSVRDPDPYLRLKDPTPFFSDFTKAKRKEKNSYFFLITYPQAHYL